MPVKLESSVIIKRYTEVLECLSFNLIIDVEIFQLIQVANGKIFFKPCIWNQCFHWKQKFTKLLPALPWQWVARQINMFSSHRMRYLMPQKTWHFFQIFYFWESTSEKLQKCPFWRTFYSHHFPSKGNRVLQFSIGEN